jgi:membrane protein implicated in regulation of membrane protease activity
MAGMEAHQRLDRTMFWTGALLVFTPLVLALAVAGWVLYHRRKRRAEGESDRRS